MANFTQSVREIIQQNADGQDISTIDGIYAVGKDIFFGSEMNVISNEYRERFEKGFLLKFFNDELGYETFPLWRIAFQEKIFNNGEYINQIFGALDKQIFADYKVTRKNASGTSSLVTDVEGHTSNITDGTVSTTNSGTTEETTANTNVVDEDTTDTGTDTTAGTGTVAHAKTGTETVADTGTDTTLHTGTKSVDVDETDTRTKTGTDTAQTTHNTTDTLKKTGTESENETVTEDNEIILTKTGSETTDEDRDVHHYETGSYRDTNHQVTETDNLAKDNSFQVQADTPQGSLQNLRTPATDSTGTGSKLISDVTYNYASAMAEGGASHVDDNSEQVDGYTERTFTSYDQHEDGDIQSVTSFTNRADTTTEDKEAVKAGTKTYNLQDEDKKTGTETTQTTYNTEDENVKDGTTLETYNESNAETKNLQSQTTHNTTDTETRNTQDQTTKNLAGTRDVTETQNGTREVTDSSTSSTDTDTTVTGSNTSSTEATGETSDESEEISYNYNLEMIYRSMPLLNKVWEIFEDLFMFIYQ